MHRRGYVFVDVKPDNFMVLKDPKAPRSRSQVDFFSDDRVFFVDFGLMEKLRAYNGGGQRENVTRATLAGNACYCSLDVHACAVPAAKDDIEALVRSVDIKYDLLHSLICVYQLGLHVIIPSERSAASLVSG